MCHKMIARIFSLSWFEIFRFLWLQSLWHYQGIDIFSPSFIACCCYTTLLYTLFVALCVAAGRDVAKRDNSSISTIPIAMTSPRNLPLPLLLPCIVAVVPSLLLSGDDIVAVVRYIVCSSRSGCFKTWQFNCHYDCWRCCSLAFNTNNTLGMTAMAKGSPLAFETWRRRS